MSEDKSAHQWLYQHLTLSVPGSMAAEPPAGLRCGGLANSPIRGSVGAVRAVEEDSTPQAVQSRAEAFHYKGLIRN